MSRQTVTTTVRQPIRLTPVAVGIALLIAALIVTLIPHSDPTSSNRRRVAVPSGAPISHLTGSVYDPSRLPAPKPFVASAAPMSHLTGSVYEPR